MDSIHIRLHDTDCPLKAKVKTVGWSQITGKPVDNKEFTNYMELNYITGDDADQIRNDISEATQKADEASLLSLNAINKADELLDEIQNKADKNELNKYSLTDHKHNDYALVNHTHTYLTAHQDLSGYSKTDHKHADYSLVGHTHAYAPVGHTHAYLTEHQSLTDYAKKTDLSGYSKTDHKHTDYSLVGHSHAYSPVGHTHDYATAEYVDNKINDASVEIDLSDYSKTDHTHADYSLTSHTHEGYLTEHQSLDNYYTKDEVDSSLKQCVFAPSTYSIPSGSSFTLVNKGLTYNPTTGVIYPSTYRYDNYPSSESNAWVSTGTLRNYVAGYVDSSLSGYLPLTGGVITGRVNFSGFSTGINSTTGWSLLNSNNVAMIYGGALNNTQLYNRFNGDVMNYTQFFHSNYPALEIKQIAKQGGYFNFYDEVNILSSKDANYVGLNGHSSEGILKVEGKITTGGKEVATQEYVNTQISNVNSVRYEFDESTHTLNIITL